MTNDMTDAIWQTEEQFWTGGAEHYRAAMHADCVMAFQQPVGIMTGQAILEAMEGAARWTAVSMTDRHERRPAAGTVVLAYRAQGTREEAAPYEADCTSTYVKVGKDWKLVQHQQTPR